MTQAVNTEIKGKVVLGIEQRTFYNEQFKTNWTADCIVFEDGTYLALCSDDSIEFILRT